MDDRFHIHYTITLKDGEIIEFPFELNRHTLELYSPTPDKEQPDWTQLSFNQCSHCPLTPDEGKRCPLAVHLNPIASRFSTVTSFDPVQLTVVTEERTITQQTTAQQCLSSIMGLVTAASGCPHSQFLRPMARFHLPLAEAEETAYRAVSMYMLAQYLRKQKGKHADWSLDELVEIFKNMREVNRHMSTRLKAAVKEDASVNAVIILDMFAENLSGLLDISLEELEPLFEPYFNHYVLPA